MDDYYIDSNSNINNEEMQFDELYEYQEYYLIKGNNAFKIKIEKTDNNILIKCKNYEIQFNNYDLSFLTKMEFHSIDQSYNYIVKIFEECKVIIKDILYNQTMKLILKIIINNKEKDIELVLIYNNENKNYNSSKKNKIILMNY